MERTRSLLSASYFTELAGERVQVGCWNYNHNKCGWSTNGPKPTCIMLILKTAAWGMFSPQKLLKMTPKCV